MAMTVKYARRGMNLGATAVMKDPCLRLRLATLWDKTGCVAE